MTAWKRAPGPAGWYPQRGDVCLVQLDKERPVVILSSNILNANSRDVCILPVTTAEHRAFSFRPKLPAGEGGLQRDSWVKCDQPTTIEKQLVVYPRLGFVSGGNMQRIEAAVKLSLDLH